jgi:transcriptional antiterminator NusG
MAEDVTPTAEHPFAVPPAPPQASAPAEPAPAEPDVPAAPPAEAAADGHAVSEPMPEPAVAVEKAPAVADAHHEPEEEPAAAPDEEAAATDEAAADEVAGDEPEEAAVDEGESAPAAEAPEAPPENPKRWYVVKVQSNREDTIKEAIERRVRKEGLEEFYGQIVIPVEKYTEVKQDKNGRKVTRTKERKLYPGYLFCEVEYNDRILYLFRETSGVGDFVGSHPNKLERAPTPMSDTEVLRMIGPVINPGDEPSPIPPPPKGMGVGDRVRVADGAFVGMEGVVKQILDTVGKVQVEVTIFGRPVGVELDYYQVEEI